MARSCLAQVLAAEVLAQGNGKQTDCNSGENDVRHHVSTVVQQGIQPGICCSHAENGRVFHNGVNCNTTDIVDKEAAEAADDRVLDLPFSSPAKPTNIYATL